MHPQDFRREYSATLRTICRFCLSVIKRPQPCTCKADARSTTPPCYHHKIYIAIMSTALLHPMELNVLQLNCGSIAFHFQPKAGTDRKSKIFLKVLSTCQSFWWLRCGRRCAQVCHKKLAFLDTPPITVSLRLFTICVNKFRLRAWHFPVCRVVSLTLSEKKSLTTCSSKETSCHFAIQVTMC